MPERDEGTFIILGVRITPLPRSVHGLGRVGSQVYIYQVGSGLSIYLKFFLKKDDTKKINITPTQ